LCVTTAGTSNYLRAPVRPTSPEGSVQRKVFV
jgi:hypothetical protein